MIRSLIYNFAKECGGTFHLKSLLNFLCNHQKKIQLLLNTLTNMIENGEITPVGPDLYQIGNYSKSIFKTHPSPSDLDLHNYLKRNFPFATICIWNIQELAYFAQHIPNLNFTIVEVEKDLIGPVSDRLSEINGLLALTSPPTEVIQNLSTFENLVILKKLISQAPLTDNSDSEKYCSTPRLEKILVDILCDNEFFFLRGMETEYIYQNAFDSYQINISMLRRYAGRRNRQNEVETFINKLGNIQ